MTNNIRNSHPIIARLRAVRIEKGVKQKELAAVIEINPSSMSAYENGASMPQIDTVDDWAVALDMNLVLVYAPGAGKTARPKISPQSDTTPVRLTQYQIVLAIGMLSSAAHSTSTEKLSKDLVEISEILARALGA